ncbi:MAG: N-acetylmuramoyl-L-alanine amidase [Devosiaceae bacterium]|nr:N-acetylmuramoyl-L-alanine amidase [Devosiaceae bacterium MH13]
MSAYPPIDTVVPSPNHDGRKGAPVDLLVLHYTGMADDDAAVRWLADPRSKVSCHYLVHEDGRIVQLVEEQERAWHAGVSSWKGEADINARSIGIEICNPGHEHGYRAFPAPQIDAVIGLCVAIVARHGIAPEHVLAHSDVAPERKEDPGELFPWDRLAAAGVGHYMEPAPILDGRFMALGDAGEPVAALQGMLKLYGYGVEATDAFDARTQAVVTAFQRHFRPQKVDGVADSSTVATLHQLLRSLIA